MSPPADRDQFVNLPTWLWLDPASWTPQPLTAAAPRGESITVVATPVAVTWYLGNGDQVVCQGPGTPFTPGTDARQASPDCGYTYRRSSAGQVLGRYWVRAAISWRGSWTSTGSTAGSGTLPTVQGLPTAPLGVRVAELQSLNLGVFE